MSSPSLIFPSQYDDVGRDARQLVTLANKGVLTRVRHGVYIDAKQWRELSFNDRYRLQVAAFTSAVHTEPILAHATAAGFWGLWLVGFPTMIHVLTATRSSGRSANGIRRHFGAGQKNTIRCGPLVITDKLTTVMDLIGSLSFPEAVAVCDSSQRISAPHHQVNVFTSTENPSHEPQWQSNNPQSLPLLRGELLEAAAKLPSQAARRRALAVINFSSALSESAGESLSRARMHMFGFPAPELQRQFTLRNGANAYADFYFEDFKLVGEFDGKGKYLKSEWAHGATIADRVLAEKAREDQIRAQGVGVVRWDWAEMMNRERFVSLLRAAGLPQKIRRNAKMPSIP